MAENNKQYRENIVWLFAGTRGTGKTTAVKQVVKSSLMKKKLVVDSFDSPVWEDMEHFGYENGVNEKIPIIDIEMLRRWQSGTYRLIGSDLEPIMDGIEQSVMNALIVFEDATKYIGSRLNSNVKRFVLDSKQKNLDLVFIFHSLVSIPPDLVRVANYLTLFKTQEGLPSTNKYPFPEIPVAMDALRKSTNKYEHKTIRLN